ncbi:MAG TPA: threonine--tRNA ligase [Candidatus Nanoarchaeia archaeon]|nr:threonine--tRNA ligase [Candidatus Nanoarchaeia archaeon]
MKILTLHCDYIKFKPLKKAIKEPEELKEKGEISVKEPLVVLIAIEKGDNDKTVAQLVDAVKKTASDVKAKNIVLYPYAHLSSNLSSPDTALEYLVEAEQVLKKQGYNVSRAPFGYYKEFELKVKGHPLSELSKEFRPEGLALSPKDVVIRHDSSDNEQIDPSRLLREISRSKLDTSKLKENDHRILGQKLDLFSFNEASPGSVFWHPKGQIIFNELLRFSRDLQKEMGYSEVSTPQIYSNKLWKVSGHWGHYKENMFLTEYEGKPAAVKPMNCPGHMLLYRTKSRSYKDLPMRFSEYSPLHRMELSGVLNGLFRVIRLHQDDSHIFATIEQLESEISNVINLAKKIYKETFKFEFDHINLSTRPEKFLGKKEDWDRAEAALEKVLKKSKIKYAVGKGEGVFYGPKIDFHIKDSMGRTWQCATIQLDMQLPQRFELTYTGEDNKEHTPLVIHRAIFGSLERFIGVLLEHLNGNLPLWLSPVQVRIINFTDRNSKACEKILKELEEEIPNLRIDSDLRSTTVSDKIRDAEMQKIPYMIVIGDKEEESKTISVRARGDNKPNFKVKLKSLIEEIKEKIKKRA